MTKSSWPLLAASLLGAILLPAFAQAQVQPADISYEGFRNVRTNGNNSTYGQALTHRYVGGELRFLTIVHGGILHEFRIAGTSFGDTITQTTGTWDLGPTGALNNFNGIWFEQAKNRLWLTSAQDYTNVNHPAKVTLITLGSNSAATALKTFFLNIPAKRVYGGCNAVPAALVSQLGGPYVCGWGGYTSLVAQGGGASIGPTMYAIPDPDTVGNGATLSARTILDTASSRGVRKTTPVNYFDGGDPRQNPPTRPTSPPLSTANWLSPDSRTGLGWMAWGDSYYNTGVWIGETFASVASLCGVSGATTTTVGTTTIPGSGACWYQSSTLAFDGRQFELHTWNGASLGSDPSKRPDTMTELVLPVGNTRVWGGNSPAGNIAGATYDAVSGRLYLIGFPFGTDYYTGRLFSFTVNGAGGGTPPPPPTDTAPPTVSLDAPGSGATVTGTVTLSASATDDGAVAGVWFTVDGTTEGNEDTTFPYSTSWSTASIANGPHAIRALARDAAGNVAASSLVSVTVDNVVADTAPPSVSVTTPSDNSTVSGTATVAADASDDVGIESVQFTLNGVNLGAPDTTSPHSINWSTLGAANGAHVLRAIARDVAGNVTMSAARTVTVSNATADDEDTTAPSVQLSAPGPNSMVSGTVEVAASASDDVGVASVQFFLDGVKLGAPEVAAPYTINWDTLDTANGSHILQAVAVDAAGNTATSASLTVKVRNSNSGTNSRGKGPKGSR